MKRKIYVILSALLGMALIFISALGCGGGDKEEDVEERDILKVPMVALGEVQLEGILRQQLTGAGLEIVDFSELDNKLTLEFPSAGGEVSGSFIVSQDCTLFNPREEENAKVTIIWEGEITGTYSSGTTGTFAGTVEITLRGATGGRESEPESHQWDWEGSLNKDGHIDGSIADIPFEAEVSES